MSRLEFDDECKGCKPVLIDGKTKKVLPDGSPEMQTIDKVWATTTREEREAFHGVCCLNSRAPSDLLVMQRLSERFRAASSN